eukprot:scaffold64862_cov71-Phaeocystis_antarctica.AAC.1
MCCLTAQRPRLAICPEGSHSRQAETKGSSRARPTPVTRRLADCVLSSQGLLGGDHGRLGSPRPPNHRVLGRRGELLLHEGRALGAAVGNAGLLEREGLLEKVAAGKQRRCVACELLHVHFREPLRSDHFRG